MVIEMGYEETKKHLDEVATNCVLFMKDANTEDNLNTKQVFIDFAWQETGGVYFQALKKLLENYSADYKYASLFEQIEGLKASIIELQETLKPKVEEKKEEPRFF
jgi:hypothetical protein